MDVTEVGMEKARRELHAMKPYELIVLREVGIETVLREEQEEKALTPMPVTVVGMKMAVMVVHPEKA